MVFFAILKPILKTMYKNPYTYLPSLELALHCVPCPSSNPGVFLTDQCSSGAQDRALVGHHDGVGRGWLQCEWCWAACSPQPAGWMCLV